MSDLLATVLMRTVRAGSRDCVLNSPAGTVSGTLIATVVSFGNSREAASAQLSATVPIFAESLAKA